MTSDEQEQAFQTRHSSLVTALNAVWDATGEKTGTAIDWATLRGVKGHCGLLSALRALDGDFDALAHAGCLCGGDGREAFVLGLLAGLTSLGFVLKTLVVKKDLFASSPNKILSTINALDIAILEFHLGMAPLSIRRACGLCL